MAAPLKLRAPGAQTGTDRPGRGALVCIGFMGAGKSTAARSAAAALGVEAVDADGVIEERLGKPIHEVFAADGESAFRAAEERITLELLERSVGGRCRLGRRCRRPCKRARGARRSPRGVAGHRA